VIPAHHLDAGGEWIRFPEHRVGEGDGEVADDVRLDEVAEVYEADDPR
jgi:hypothetical protein